DDVCGAQEYLLTHKAHTLAARAKRPTHWSNGALCQSNLSRTRTRLPGVYLIEPNNPLDAAWAGAEISEVIIDRVRHPAPPFERTVPVNPLPRIGKAGGIRRSPSPTTFACVAGSLTQHRDSCGIFCVNNRSCREHLVGNRALRA